MIGKLFSDLGRGATFAKGNSFRAVFNAVLSRDAHPLLQFGKYVACGGVAFMTHQLVALALGLYVFPDQEYSLELQRGEVAQLPIVETCTVSITEISDALQLQVIDADGTIKVDSDATAFAGKEAEISALKTILAPHWNAAEEMPFNEKARAIDRVAEISGYDPDTERKRHSFINNTIAFALATVVAYVLNVAFVFTSGRHSKRKEIFLFVAVSLISYVGGIAAVDFTFRFLGSVEALASVTQYLSIIANLGFAFTSAMVNYVCRKFIIFQK